MNNKLPAEAWTVARRRWEGDKRPGFEWLRREVAGPFGVELSRAAFCRRAAREGWRKGGPPSRPLVAVSTAAHAPSVVESLLLVAAELQELQARLQSVQTRLRAIARAG